MPQGASGALGKWIPGTFAFGDANAGGVLRAVPIQSHFHTAWATRRLRHCSNTSLKLY